MSEELIASGAVTRKQIERLKPRVAEEKQSQQIPGYQILDRLGAGAMATVYKAKQLSLDRIVAIKVLPQKFTKSKQFVERFYAEGRAAAKLNHPNIVGALDVGQAGEYHYFVMEYVEGHTVFDDITAHGAYKEEDALSIAIQMARALEHAHKAGFIHRDVKPKNIMIMPSGQAKLADMGLARAVSDREAAEEEKGKAFGTPYYISPEQVRGDPTVDYRADIYSLGCTLYHMVTGKVPFEGANPSIVMTKHLKEEPIPPDHVNPNLSSGIGEVIELCMHKEPDERYNSTSDLLHDLEALERGEPPVQARKKFDLSSLSALAGPDGDTAPEAAAMNYAVQPLTSQPAFYLAIAGWAVALVLLLILIVTLAVSGGSQTS